MQTSELTTIATITSTETSIEYLSNELFDAVKEGNLDRVRELIGNGANVNATVDWERKIPLHIAAEKGHLEIVKYIIEKGADLNAISENGSTPLHGATRNKKWDIVKLLIEKEADFKVTNKDGQTPLLYEYWGYK